MTQTILIVDDEATQLRVIGAVTEREGYQTRYAVNGQEAIDILSKPDASGVDLVILDLSMPRISGLDVLKRIKPKHPDLPCIVLTAHSSISNVVDSMRAGASDFLVKPASAERIRTAIRNVLEAQELTGELRPLTEKIDETLQFSELVGASEAMKAAVAVARKAAASNIPVLVEGESGVGKELFARAIQASSARARGPFITVNCGAIPANLVESILFGHEKGAFTGASERHVGKFVEANKGTIFLDEIGELPLDTQVKLLRVLQESEVEAIGGRETVKVDVRVISATNRDLARQVSAGEFREDLYYRLNVFPVRIPPLRRRREDIPSLVKHFIARISKAENIAVKDIEPGAMELLQNYEWPGNVRQLQNAIFRAVVLSDHEVLTVADFPQVQLQTGGAVFTADQAAPGAGAAPGETHVVGGLALFDKDGHIRSLSEVEAEVIRRAMARYKGHMSEVARRLGIGRSTLYRKVAELNLDGDADAERDPDRGSGAVIPTHSHPTGSPHNGIS
ncbi:MAG: sigma-54-dependent transcriptional regulator [Pseudomonadota bacterium]